MIPNNPVWLNRLRRNHSRASTGTETYGVGVLVVWRLLRCMQLLHGQRRLSGIKFLERWQERGQEIGKTFGKDGAVVGHDFGGNGENPIGRVIPGVAVL